MQNVCLQTTKTTEEQEKQQYTLKSSLFFKKNTNLGGITHKFLKLRMLNFQSITFVWIRTSREIFKSALVCLWSILNESAKLCALRALGPTRFTHHWYVLFAPYAPACLRVYVPYSSLIRARTPNVSYAP